MKCDIVIPIWNQLEFTKSCIDHILKNTRYPYRLMLVDNGSDIETKNYLETLKQTQKTEINLIRNGENLGFVRAVNQGLKDSIAPYVCILNNDTLPGVGWLTELVEFAEKHPDTGLLNPLCNGHIGQNLSVNEYARMVSSSNKGKYMEMNQCQGFSMLIKREIIDKIGYLDERFGIGGFDDTDYSMRVHRAGYKSVCVYSSYVYHREHVSFNKMGERKKIQSNSEKAYFRKWPRHLRILVIFSISEKVTDERIANFLKSALFLARQWCWVNLLVFGAKTAKKRINNVKENISFPLHQNIKFNYLNNKIKILEISARILERAFGTKRRKRYDAAIYSEAKLTFLLKILCKIQGCKVFLDDFSRYCHPEPFDFAQGKLREGSNSDSSSFLTSLMSRTPQNDNSNMNLKCDIILPVCDQYKFTKKCIESIIKNTDTPYRLIIINNGKNPDTKRFLENLKNNKEVELTVVNNDHNIGWVKALNRGMEISTAPYICFQNDDTIVTRGWLKKMINILKLQENFGMINPTWEGRPKNLSIDRYNSILERKAKKRFIETDWCRGFSAVFKRAVIEKIGKVDEAYGLAYFDDVDYSVTAIEAGFLALRALDTYVYHHRNITFFEVLKGRKWNELHEKNKCIYYKKWGRPLKISLLLNKTYIKDKDYYNKIISTMFYLARKQHRIYIWSPDLRIRKSFQHTNIVFKSYTPGLLNTLFSTDLYFNTRKKPEKKYDAVFVYDRKLGKRLSKRPGLSDIKLFYNNKSDFNDFIIQRVDSLKEKTKKKINIKM
ncbi:MAG: glycosyltransferase [Candidatus Omnitrophica bacterium]|nr:glycosyltransferase [Candidatus Omnitrophota bacterium]